MLFFSRPCVCWKLCFSISNAHAHTEPRWREEIDPIGVDQEGAHAAFKHTGISNILAFKKTGKKITQNVGGTKTVSSLLCVVMGEKNLSCFFFVGF